jgi:hypothetical protein
MDDKRINDTELAWLNATFAGNKEGLKTLRKLFLYEIAPSDPLGMGRDMWTELDLTNVPKEKRETLIEARQMMIGHINGALVVLAKLAGDAKETIEETQKRIAQDSSK